MNATETETIKIVLKGDHEGLNLTLVEQNEEAECFIKHDEIKAAKYLLGKPLRNAFEKYISWANSKTDDTFEMVLDGNEKELLAMAKWEDICKEIPELEFPE